MRIYACLSETCHAFPPTAEKAPFGDACGVGHLWPVKNCFGGMGACPHGLGLDERMLKSVWVNACGCGKIILIARVRHFRMKKPPLVAWTLWKAVKGILGRKHTHSERMVKCAFSFFRIKRFHRPIYRPTPWASRRVLSTRSKAHFHASEGDMGKCAFVKLTNTEIRTEDFNRFSL